MRVSTVFLACLVLACALAVSASRHSRQSVVDRFVSRVPLYTRSDAPTGWRVVGEADPSALLSFTLVVEGSNSAELEERFWQVSDPDHPSYGQFMTNAEIEAMVAPPLAEVNSLYTVLSAHGIERHSVVSHGDSYEVTASVKAASSLFSTSFHDFVHTKTGIKAVRQLGESSLPTVLASQVKLVLGVHTFPTIEQRLRMSEERRAMRASIKEQLTAQPRVTPCWVPKAIASIYGVPYPIAPLSTPEINAGVIEWSQQTFSARDLSLFSNRTMVPLAPVDAHHIVGNNSEVPFPGIEAELDIQWIEGVNPAFTPWFWLVSDPQQWMYSFTLQFLVATDYPSVISLSYGLPELDQCMYFNPSDCHGVDYRTYIHLVDKQFMKIGLLGTSIITATQDRGVYAPAPPNAAARFTPEYPGSSAFVTSVGATEYINPVFELANPPPACNSTQWRCISGGSDEESVSPSISGFRSSGGFSDVDPIPSYQTAAVAAYFASGIALPNQTLWNRTGRGSPDVSAIGMNGYVIDNLNADLVSGASMSTPIFAAIMALVQADYYKLTNTTLGFLNPLLYKGQAAGGNLFKDIVLGDNYPVSGLGSPLYPGLKAYIAKVAEKVLARRAAAL